MSGGLASGIALLGALQIALALLLCAAAWHLGRSALAAWRWPIRVEEAPPVPPGADGSAPFLTVQLPLRNERAVCARVIEMAAALDWPRDRFELQILDDSDDETRQVVDAAAARVGAAGTSALVLRRAHRRGFKAGALQEALATARGEYLLVLDADSQPEPDLARRLIAPLARDPALAFTEGRWRFDNEGESLLTRAQALILDGLMLVEQPLLSARGRPVQFNGTAGVWRRSALLAAGGWLRQGDGAAGSASVTEDLDLAYRARLAGHLGRALPEVSVLTELPSTMAAFRAQQQRWVRGGAEVLRALWRQLSTGALPPGERFAMLSHLARHARQPLLVLSALWLPPATAGLVPLPLAGAPFSLVVAALVAAVGFYYAAARRRAGRSGLLAFALSPSVIALSMGLSLALTTAFLRGLLAGQPGEFVRTPKGRAYGARRDPLAVLEVGLGVYSLGFAALAVARGFALPGLALAILDGAGWLWVGVASLRSP